MRDKAEDIDMERIRKMYFTNTEFSDVRDDRLTNFKTWFQQMYTASDNTVREYLDELNNLKNVKLHRKDKAPFLNRYKEKCEDINLLERQKQENGGNLNSDEWFEQCFTDECRLTKELQALYSGAQYPDQKKEAEAAFEKFNASLKDPDTDAFVPARPDKIAALCSETGIYGIMEPSGRTRILLSNGAMRFYQGELALNAANTKYLCRGFDKNIAFEAADTDQLEEHLNRVNEIEMENAENIVDAIKNEGETFDYESRVVFMDYALVADPKNNEDYFQAPPAVTSVFKKMDGRLQNIQILDDFTDHHDEYGHCGVAYNCKAVVPYQIFDTEMMMTYSMTYNVSMPGEKNWNTIFTNVQNVAADCHSLITFDSILNDLEISNEDDLNRYQIILPKGLPQERGDYAEGHYPSVYLGEHVLTIQKLAKEGAKFATFGEMNKAVTEREYAEMIAEISKQRDETYFSAENPDTLDDILLRYASAPDYDSKSESAGYRKLSIDGR